MQIYIFCKALWKSLKKTSCLYRIKILECWVIWTFYYLFLLGDIINPHIPLESDAKYGLTKKEVILNSLKKKMFGVVLKPLFNYYYRYLKLFRAMLAKNLGFSSSNNFGLNKVQLFRDNIHSLFNMFVSRRKLMLPGKMYLIESLRSDLWGTSKSMIQHSIKRNSSHKPIISTYRHINASKGMVIQWLFIHYINCQCWVHVVHFSTYWLICENWFASQYCIDSPFNTRNWNLHKNCKKLSLLLYLR